MTAGSISVPQIIPLRPPRGHRKHVINSNTEIDIKSENVVFYTLNNKRPDPFQVYGEKYTYKFECPFTLAPGKVTIKAMAMSQDCLKQSSVVTRSFLVHEGGERVESDIRNEQIELHGSELSLSQQFRHRLRQASRESVTIGLSDTLITRSPSPTSHFPPSPSPNSYIPHSQSQTTPSPRQTSPSPYKPISTGVPISHDTYPMCLYCSIPLKSTTSQIFCTNCGSKIPQLPQVSDEPTRLTACPSCRSELPPDTEVCQICDSTLPQLPTLPTIRVQSEKDLKEMITCLHCGTHNPPNLVICTTCDQSLLTKHQKIPAFPGECQDTIMHPIIGSSYVMCGTCGRVNVSDARFCDWCGCKPVGSDIQLMCQSCETNNKWQARFCQNCGAVMKTPLRPDVEQGNTMQMPRGIKIDQNKWTPITDIIIHREDKTVTAEPETHTRGTQTQGLFYPSQKTITTNKQTETWQKLVKTISQDRVIQLSTYSPGKGLWRAQVEHIVNHLKAHCSSSAKLQESLADRQLGKLIRSSVNEENNEVSINLVFTLKSDELDKSLTSYQNQVSPNNWKTRRRSSTLSSTTSQHKLSNNGKKPLRRANSSHLTLKVEDHLLTAELSSTGQGRQDIVASLLEKGARIDAIDPGGLPMLLLAACNGHLDAMNTLIEHGADLNIQAKRTGHTALHEAVSKGLSRKDIIQSLLSHGADPSVKNKDNLTPCELARHKGYKKLILLFANMLGSSMLGQLLPSQTNN